LIIFDVKQKEGA